MNKSLTVGAGLLHLSKKKHTSQRGDSFTRAIEYPPCDLRKRRRDQPQIEKFNLLHDDTIHGYQAIDWIVRRYFGLFHVKVRPIAQDLPVFLHKVDNLVHAALVQEARHYK